VSTWFSRSGASPPSFHPSPLISARVGVSPLFRISSQTGDRVLQQIQSFNFQVVPNGECILARAAWCVRSKPRIQSHGDRTRNLEEIKMNHDKALNISEELESWTKSVVRHARQDGLELPFTVEHHVSGQRLHFVEVIKNEEEGGLRYLLSDERWEEGFNPTDGDEVTVTLTDNEKEVIREKYTLFVRG
jgi:hypothetical protein